MIRARDDSRGVILIALLWILTILSVIAMSFARETFVEVSAARNARDLTDAYYIARAGIASTIHQLYQRMYLTQQNPANLAMETVDPIDLGKITGQFGDGEYEVRILDESGKFNLNFVREEELRALMAVIGIEPPDADIIVDSILDWRDADQVSLANGAEDDYYQALIPPYQSRNGNGLITSVEELLLIRGVTPEYYYGHREKMEDGTIVERYGLSRYFTAYSVSDRININSAPLQVLLSVQDMPPEAAQMICELRDVKPFTNPLDINKEVVPNLGPTTLARFATNWSGIFTLEAAAHRTNSKVRRAIRAVVRLDPNEPDKYRVLYWNENVANW